MLGQVTAVKKGNVHIRILPLYFFIGECLTLQGGVSQSKTEYHSLGKTSSRKNNSHTMSITN